MINRPIPPARPVEISATTTPTTDAVAARRSAGTRYGTAAGNRSLNNVCRHDAAYESISSTAAGGAEVSPLRVPTATGKNARNAPSTAADSHRGHSKAPMCSFPPQLTTSGASAISGTVCDTTRYGRRPRSTTLKRAITIARPSPTSVPITNPASANRSENHAPDATVVTIGVENPRRSGWA
jgi:hypothetical protein